MGKPFYLGLKASLRTGMLYDYGLDVDRLVREGLVDFIGLSNTFQTSWHADIDAQKRRYGDSVAVYGYMEGAINWLQVLANPEAGRSAEQSRKRGRDMAYSGEYLLGNAAGKLVLGADGLIQYNNFIERDAGAKSSQAEWALRGLSDLESLRGRPKAYSMESAFFDPLGSVALEAPWTLPEWIAPSHCRAFRLPMCTEPQEAGLKLLVELIVERKRTESRPAVSINGHFPSAEYIKTDRILFASGDYGTLLPEHEGFVFSFSTAAIEEGWNEITVFNLVKEKADGAENGAETFRLMSLEIGIMSGEDARAIVGAHTGAEQA